MTGAALARPAQTASKTPETVPYALFAQEHNWRIAAEKRVAELERENAKFNAKDKWQKKFAKITKLDSTDKEIVKRLLHHEEWGEVHDEEGRVRINFTTIGGDTGVHEDTVSRHFKQRIATSNLVDAVSIKDPKSGEERWYVKLNREIIDAADDKKITFTKDPPKHGGDRYTCKKCGTKHVRVKRHTTTTIICLDKKCGHVEVEVGPDHLVTTSDGEETESNLPDICVYTGGGDTTPIDDAGDTSEQDAPMPSISQEDVGARCSAPSASSTSQENTEQDAPTESTRPNWYDAIPAELKAWAQWVVWRYGAMNLNTGKRDKVPYDAKKKFAPRYGCDYTDPASFATFEQALARYEESQSWKMPYEGIGFCFTKNDPFCGADGDYCRDKETGELNEYARTNLVLGISTYWEVSPSENGIKGIGKASIPDNSKTKAVELYDHDRFFAITGNHLPGTPTTIEAVQEQVTALYQSIAPSQPEYALPSPTCSVIEPDDEKLLARAMYAKNGAGEEFAALWKNDVASWGQWYSKKDGSPDHSRADWHLIKYLLFYSGNDIDRVEKLCWASALARPKWNDKRKDKKTGQAMTFLQWTIRRSIPSVCTKPSPSDPVEVAA